jgi:anti-sigma regulatory factor (Ser/Thr protein kinase)
MGPRHTQRPGGPAAGGCRTTHGLPRDPAAAGLARRELVSGLSDVPDDVVEVAKVLISELVTNALRHGRGLITMSVDRDERSITVRVTDEGPQVPVVRDHDLTALSGRGLQLVEALAEGWGTERAVGGGKVVWFRLRTALR